GAALFLAVAIMGIPSLVSDDPVAIAFEIVFLLLLPLSIFMGRALRRLDRWVRVPAIVLSIPGLISFPLGTLINGYIIYLLACAKGKQVFSPEYQTIIRQTPHIKYKTSWIVIVLLVLVVGLILVGFIAGLLVG